MKKIFTLGAMLAATFTLTNCTEEFVSPVESENTPYTIQANPVSTKTANEGMSTVWVENDALSVFHAAAGSAEYSGNSKFVLTNAAEGLFMTDALDGAPAASNDWYVIYPYNSGLKTPAGTSEGYMTVGAQAGQKQTQTGNGSMEHIAGGNYPMWGVAKNVSGETLPAVGMTHLTSLVEVEVTNASSADFTVSTVALTASEDIVGTYQIDFTKETPVFTASGSQSVSKTAALEVVNGAAVPANGTAKFYLAVKPFTAAAGSDLILSVNGTDKVLNLAKDAAFASGKIKTLKYTVEDASAEIELAILAGEVTVSDKDIEVPLEAMGADKIYYHFLSSAERRKYDTDEKRIDYLFAKGKAVSGTAVVAKASEVRTAISASTPYMLIALATGTAGNQSPLFTMDCKTAEKGSADFNNLVVNLEVEKNAPNNVRVSISSEGAEDFLYWVGKTTDNTWKSVNYMGGTVAKAEKYMIENPDIETFATVKAKYPITDGMIHMTDLEMDVEHVLVAMAKSKDGLYSRAAAVMFTPLSVDMGDVVKSSDPRWEAAKPTVEWIPERFFPQQGMMSGNYAYRVTIPQNFTGYVLSGSDAYMTEGDEEYLPSKEEMIVKIINYVDRPQDDDKCVDEELWKTQGYPYGYEFYHYEHGGKPGNGVATIWASQEYHDSVCSCGGNFDDVKIRTGYDDEGNEISVSVPNHHVIFINDGKPFEISYAYATGDKTKVVDVVFVVCRDLDGNCYEPYRFEVPFEYFANATAY